MFVNLKLVCFFSVTVLPMPSVALRPKDAYEKEAAVLAGESEADSLNATINTQRAFIEQAAESEANLGRPPPKLYPMTSASACKQEAENLRDARKKVWDSEIWSQSYRAALKLMWEFKARPPFKLYEPIYPLAYSLGDLTRETEDIWKLLDEISKVPQVKKVPREPTPDDDSTEVEVPIPEQDQLDAIRPLLDRIFTFHLDPTFVRPRKDIGEDADPNFPVSLKNVGEAMPAAIAFAKEKKDNLDLNFLVVQEHGGTTTVDDENDFLDYFRDTYDFLNAMIAVGKDRKAMHYPEREKNIHNENLPGPWDKFLGACIPCPPGSSDLARKEARALTRDWLRLLNIIDTPTHDGSVWSIYNNAWKDLKRVV